MRTLLLSALLVATTACSSTGGEAPTRTPTLVAVAPQDFLGEVVCADAPGAARRMVVTFFDLGTAEEPADPFALPSTVLSDGGAYRPLSCLQPAATGFVIPGHRYDAEVDVYDRTDVHALGPGGRTLVRDSTGEYVPPRWSTSCGRNLAGSPAEGPVTAAYYLTRYVHGCGKLVAGSDTPTAIRVGIGTALGDLTCGTDAGMVEHFDAHRLGAAPATQSAGCGDSATFSDLTPDQSYDFEVFAFESGASSPRWGTTCFRKAQAGATLDAGCDPLTEDSSIRVPSSVVSATLGISCSDISEVTGLLDGSDKKTLPCGGDLRFDGLAAAAHDVTVTTRKTDGSPGPIALCSATTMPGVVRDASCTAVQ